jgi:hypothetical protein
MQIILGMLAIPGKMKGGWHENEQASLAAKILAALVGTPGRVFKRGTEGANQVGHARNYLGSLSCGKLTLEYARSESEL